MEGKDKKDYVKLMDSLTNLLIRTTRLECECSIPAHVFTSDGEWIKVDATLSAPNAHRFDFARHVPGGTSGAPVFDDAGHVIGVVSSSDKIHTEAVYLLDALPGWMLDLISAR